MKIILAGSGDEVTSLIEALLIKKIDITVVDSSASFIDKVTSFYDVNGIVGDHLSKATLIKAGIERCDLFIGMTPSNSRNILCSSFAKSLGSRYSLSRTKNFEQASDIDYIKQTYNIDYIIDADYEEAIEIARMIQYPHLLNFESFVSGDAVIAEVIVSNKTGLTDVPIKYVKQLNNSNVIICSIRHNGEQYIPHGDSIIYDNDRVVLCGKKNDVTIFLTKFKVLTKPIKNALLIGGGKVGILTAREIIKRGIKPTIIENDLPRCQEITKMLPKTEVLCGDGTSAELLNKVKIADFDSLICVSGKDETNLVSSIYGKSKGVTKVVSEISDLNYAKMLHEINIDSTVSSYLVTYKKLIKYLGDLESKDALLKKKGDIVSMHSLNDGGTVAIEFRVDSSFKYVGLKLMDPRFKIKPNIIVALVIRSSQVIIPKGSTEIKKGDNVIIITDNKKIKSLANIVR